MPWVMTSKRFRGSRFHAPRTEFRIGSVTIAQIVMSKYRDKWRFNLHVMEDGLVGEFTSFSAALTHLHKLLNEPPPEGFETGGSPYGKETAT